jgi:hypothetical protein
VKRWDEQWDGIGIVEIEISVEGPNSLGLWRGRWKLLQNGKTIKGRCGSTPWHETSALALSAASKLARSDRRNVPNIDGVFKKPIF